MLEKIARYISEKITSESSCRMIVGVSGGADSVALLHILVKLGYTCIAAHCHFGLRGEEADRDLRIAQKLSEVENVPFESIHFDTHAYAKNHKCSIEVACRELRYKWFEELRQRFQADYIAVAHHSDDSVETLFLNLLRGTGIAGITGIKPVNGFIIRPLLCTTRSEIETYLAQEQIPYIIDSSNQLCCYTRNKIRLQLLPLLEEIRPGAAQNVARSISRLQETEALYRRYIHERLSFLVEEEPFEWRLPIDALLKEIAPGTLLFEWLSPYGFSSAQCDEILAGVAGVSGAQYLSHTHRLIKDRTHFILTQYSSEKETESYLIDATCTRIEAPLKLSFQLLTPQEAFPLLKQKGSACFDFDRLQFPLTLRHWRHGDRFIPFGMHGSRKISDYFSDQKFSLAQKERTWLLCSEEKVIWIVGHRTDATTSISTETKKVYFINCEK